MIKGLAVTPPTLGRVSIGKVVEKNGKRLPEKDDEFTITSQVQNKDGWVLHPLDKMLRQGSEAKLRSIPVSVLFDDPSLNLRSEYSLFDRTTGRPMCVGNGETCKRVTGEGIKQSPCPSPSACDYGGKAGCKPYGRLNVVIDGQEDELGSFIFRTTGFNSIRTLSARLAYYQAVSGNRLADMPLSLILRAKSTTQSHRAPVYYVDLTVREGKSLSEAVSDATTTRQMKAEAGLDQQALDAAARLGIELGAFEESEEEGDAIVEEFYPEASDGTGVGETSGKASNTLAGKLQQKVEEVVS